MSNSEKSLQKLTDLEMVNKVISKNKISRKDYSSFTKEQTQLLRRELQKIANNLKTVEEKDAFFLKFEAVITKESKNQRWQTNHGNIQVAITNLLLENNRVPSVNEISQDTKLSRQTVNKHLKNFDTQQLYQEEWNKLKYASVNVAGKVMREAIRGDMKAARLYFDILNNFSSQGKTYIKNQQNNFLTINNIRLDEPTLKSMPADLLQQIEEFVKTKKSKVLQT